MTTKGLYSCCWTPPSIMQVGIAWLMMSDNQDKWSPYSTFSCLTNSTTVHQRYTIYRVQNVDVIVKIVINITGWERNYECRAFCPSLMRTHQRILCFIFGRWHKSDEVKDQSPVLNSTMLSRIWKRTNSYNQRHRHSSVHCELTV